MARKQSVAVRRLRPEESMEGTRLGTVVSSGPRGVFVDFVGNAAGPLRARVSAMLDQQLLQRAVSERLDALLVLTGGEPVLLTVLRPEGRGEDEGAPRTTKVEGERLAMEGREEIVLRSGKSSLVLSRDGTVVLRGMRILTDAVLGQRIRGAKVRIN